MSDRSYLFLCSYLIDMCATVIMTGRDGRVSRMEHVFLRGGQIKLFVLPEILKSAKVLQKVQSMKSKASDKTPAQIGSKKPRTGH